MSITLPTSYTAHSVNTTNGAEITGDPGASEVYNFSIAVTVPANTGISALTRQIIVTDNAGNQDVCTLSLAAGDAYLTVQTGTIELTYQGTAVNVAVESNTNWTVE